MAKTVICLRIRINNSKPRLNIGIWLATFIVLTIVVITFIAPLLYPSAFFSSSTTAKSSFNYRSQPRYNAYHYKRLQRNQKSSMMARNAYDRYHGGSSYSKQSIDEEFEWRTQQRRNQIQMYKSQKTMYEEKLFAKQNIFFIYSNNTSTLNNVNGTHINNHGIRTVIATIAIYSDEYDSMFNSVVENHKHYAQTHGYDYFILRHDLEMYDYHHGPIGTQQRALLIENLLYNKKFEINNVFNKTYDKVLWIDFDALFLNDKISIDQIIQYTQKLYSNFEYQYKKNYYNLTNISPLNHVNLIVTGDWKYRINGGVMIFIKSDFIKQLLNIWKRMMKLCHVNDQFSLVMLLFLSCKQQSDHDRYHDDYFQMFSEMSDDELYKFVNIENKINSSFTLNQYQGYTVSQLQSFYVREKFIKNDEIINRIAWIQQTKMNSNIWHQLWNHHIFNQWIIHFAGQPSKNVKQLIKGFIRMKKRIDSQINNDTFNNWLRNHTFGEKTTRQAMHVHESNGDGARVQKHTKSAGQLGAYVFGSALLDQGTVKTALQFFEQNIVSYVTKHAAKVKPHILQPALNNRLPVIDVVRQIDRQNYQDLIKAQ